MLVVIAYDIPDNRRRTRLAKCLKNFGFRVQYSVFVGDLLPNFIKQMQTAVLKIVDTDEDNVHYYFLCNTCRENVQDLHGKRKTTIPKAIIS